MVVRSLLGRDGAARDASLGSSDLLVRASVLAFAQMNKEEKLQEVRAVEGEVGRVQPQRLAAAAAALHAPDFERSARSGLGTHLRKFQPLLLSLVGLSPHPKRLPGAWKVHRSMEGGERRMADAGAVSPGPHPASPTSLLVLSSSPPLLPQLSGSVPFRSPQAEAGMRRAGL